MGEKKHVGEEKQVREIDRYQRHNENERIILNKKKNKEEKRIK